MCSVVPSPRPESRRPQHQVSTWALLGFAGLVSAGLAVAAGSADTVGQLSFERVDAAVGSPTNAIRTHDLNHDGRLDLVVSGGGSVFVLTGRGDGRFDVSWSSEAGENPVDLAIADLDADGLADLAVANHETDYVTLFFGVAGGGFERREHSQFRVDVSPHPHAVALHDVDSDGRPDLLVDDRSLESIRWFRGRGDGTFSGAQMIDVGGDPYRGMSLADVTGDGLADGTFSTAGRYEIARGPTKSAAADLTGDGAAEVLVASYAGGEVAVLIGGDTPLLHPHRDRRESLRPGHR